ncbi:hypothetical protein GMRT_13166 [Giardia muris]|uniref:Uncharacterized protein n=1 Tax=Giardia muris TaxID=5742 RepID=A0A4Z1SLZ4_GIAMU|nr:hypothetical protein GMRT_13166 [Giardia muris]|eukprot:TNJ26686.1 hypothetical protein GMRT_13166 [Giardia muris]
MSRNRRHNTRSHEQEMSRKDAKALLTLYQHYDNGAYGPLYTDAVSLLERHPNNPDVLCMKGIALCSFPPKLAREFLPDAPERTALDQARVEGWNYIERAIAQIPAGNSGLYMPYHIASIACRSDRLEGRAIEYLKKALVVAPNVAVLNRDLATLYYHSQDYKKCHEQLLGLLKALTSGSTAQLLRYAYATRYLMHYAQEKCSEMLQDLDPIYSALHRAANESLAESAAHRDVSLYRLPWHEVTVSLVEKLRVIAQCRPEPELYARLLASFDKKVSAIGGTRKCFDRDQVLQAYAEYKRATDARVEYWTALRLRFSKNPMDLSIYEEVFREYVRLHGDGDIDVSSFKPNLLLTADDSSLLLEHAPLYALLYDAFVGHVARGFTSPSDSALSCLNATKDFQGPSEYFVVTLRARLAALARNREALKAEALACLEARGKNYPAAGLARYVARLLSSVEGLADDVLCELKKNVTTESAFVCQYGALLIALPDPPVDECCSIVKDYVGVEDGLVTLSTESDHECTRKLYLNTPLDENEILERAEKMDKEPNNPKSRFGLTAEELAVEKETFSKLYAGLLAKRTEALALKKTITADECLILSRMAGFASRPRTAVALMELATLMDNGDRYLSRLTARAVLPYSVDTGFALYGKFVYASDPWITAVETQDVTFLTDIVSAIREGPEDILRSSEAAGRFVRRFKAAVEVAKIIESQSYDLADFMSFATRTGCLYAFGRGQQSFRASLHAQECIQPALEFLLEVFSYVYSLTDDAEMGRIETAVRAAGSVLEEEYAHRVEKSKGDEYANDRVRDCDASGADCFLMLLTTPDLNRRLTAGQNAFYACVWCITHVYHPKDLRGLALQQAAAGKLLLALKTAKDFEELDLGAVVGMGAGLGLAQTPSSLLKTGQEALLKAAPTEQLRRRLTSRLS